MATPASEVVELIREAMAGAPGVQKIKIDGAEVELDLNALDYWEKRAARESTPNRRPIVNTIDLSGF